MKKLALLMGILLCCCPTNAIAQTMDEEEVFDNGIQQFGYVSGAAFQCASSNQAVNIERDVVRNFTRITRLFGSDRAFLYAAAYGSGATTAVDPSKCRQYMRQFQESTRRNALNQGEQ